MFCSPTSLTCSEDVKVRGFVGDVAHWFDSWAFDRDLGGVAQRFVHIHLKRAFGNLLACKQHRHLGNREIGDPETSGGAKKGFWGVQKTRGADLVRSDDLRNVGDTEGLLAFVQLRLQLLKK